jgi:hypothetical protein
MPANSKMLKGTPTSEAVLRRLLLGPPCTYKLNVDITDLTEYLFLYPNIINTGPIQLLLGSSTGEFVEDGMTVYFYQATNPNPNNGMGEYPCVQTWDKDTNTVICVNTPVTYISPYICGITFPGQATQYSITSPNNTNTNGAPAQKIIMNQNYQYTNGILPGFLRIAIANDTICTWSDYIPITYADPNNTLPVVKTGWVEPSNFAGYTTSNDSGLTVCNCATPTTCGPIWSPNTGDSGNKTEYIVTSPEYTTTPQIFGDICFKSTTGYSISFTIYINDNDAYKKQLITGVLFVWANDEHLQYWYHEGVEYNGTPVNNMSNNNTTMASISASCSFNKNNYTNVNNLNPNGQGQWMQIIPITAGGSAIMNVTYANYYPQSFVLWSGCN